jgi:hypothetical protein
MTKISLTKNKILKDVKKPCFQEIKDHLADTTFCYVLLTCSHPSSDGDMEVEMSFDGEKDLVSYLLESGLSKLEN